MILLLLSLQQQPSPVARISVLPANPTVAAGDTLRLRAEALDAQGRVVPNATVRFFLAGARFEARVDSTGLVRAGSAGTLPVRVVATVAGAAPSRPQTITVRMTPPPAARIALEPAVSRLIVGQRLAVEATVFAANGDTRADTVQWSSSAPRVVTVAEGRLQAVAPGRATITARAGSATQSLDVTVQASTLRALEITGGAAEARTGDVLRFQSVARDAAGADVGGLQPTWSMSPGNGQIGADGAFVAYLPGSYTISASIGGARAETTVRVRARDVRRGTRVLGRFAIGNNMAGGEFWPHPNGRVAYLSTQADRLYAIDISDPGNLRVTDSVMVDARVINDVMSTADGRWAVMTREGASSRRNGIVILDLADPAHPRVAADYTETVSGGVHSAFVYTQPGHGTHVYLTDDATGSMRVIDLNDPRQPREIARWQPREQLNGNYVHDVDVKDGLAYLSYWNDGLIILDVGSGIRGGTPARPQLVSQLRYDLDALYRDVEVEGGVGFTRGTHTAWRHGRYVFVGDEVFTLRPLAFRWPNRNDLGKANGRLHVVDVSDITAPRLVAWYEPRDGGAHNVWVAGDTLYLGDYQGGLRVLDISGELKGDLLAQGREMAHVHTGDRNGVVPNAAMTWGAFLVNGVIYANDVFSGLWAVQLEPREPQRPVVP